MADVSTAPVRLLGFAGLAEAERMHATMAAIEGPALRVVRGPMIAAFVQDEPATPPARRGRKALLIGLQTVHRRLEMACQLASFLPMDPGAACCPGAAVDALLELSWEPLGRCLARGGAMHQWDLVIRWSPETVLAQHRPVLSELAATRDPARLAQAVKALLHAAQAERSEALQDALGRYVLATTPGTGTGCETEVAITVLVPCGSEGLIEAALGQIPSGLVEGASADLRGPMPPVSFHAVRLACAEAADIGRSWRLLGLPDKVDITLLHRQWRALAASAHPDRRSGESDAFTDITEAYRLLRPLLCAEPRTLRSLLRHAGHRLVLPEFTAAPGEDVGHAA